MGGKAGSVIRGGARRAGAGGAPRGSNRWFGIVSGRVRCGERCRRPGSRSSAVPETPWLERTAGHTLPARGVEDAKAGAGRSGGRASAADAELLQGELCAPGPRGPAGRQAPGPTYRRAEQPGRVAGAPRLQLLSCTVPAAEGSNSSHLLIPES